MSKPLRTDKACVIFENLKPDAQNFLSALNEHDFLEAENAITNLKEILNYEKKTGLPHEENLLNDFFVLERYTDFLTEYQALWRNILSSRFSTSWTRLQNALDLLRVLKKFSNIRTDFFENQLIELEKLYPYNVFFSTGMTIEYFECSVCGKNIDSSACSHRRGELYGGDMAHGVVRNIIETDHVAMVSHPRDKRCVVNYDDKGEQFKALQYLSGEIISQRISILNLNLISSKKKSLNPEYSKLGRNELCFCGSGIKFKKCCELKQYVEVDHTEINRSPRMVEDVIT